MEKLVEFIRFKGFSASRFAEMLGVKPAGISHILNGRNKPSYDLICKILQTFPEINPYWLLGDSGTMLNADAPAVPSEPTLLDVGNVAFSSGSVLSESDGIPAMPHTGTPASGAHRSLPFAASKSGASVARVIVVYDDRTFEAFDPKP